MISVMVFHVFLIMAYLYYEKIHKAYTWLNAYFLLE